MTRLTDLSRLTILIVPLLALVLAGCLGGDSLDDTELVRILIDFDGELDQWLETTAIEPTSALDLTLTATAAADLAMTTQTFDFGTMVTGFGDTQNEDYPGRSWLLFSWNLTAWSLAEVGAGDLAVENGDHLAWKFMLWGADPPTEAP